MAQFKRQKEKVPEKIFCGPKKCPLIWQWKASLIPFCPLICEITELPNTDTRVRQNQWLKICKGFQKIKVCYTVIINYIQFFVVGGGEGGMNDQKPLENSHIVINKNESYNERRTVSLNENNLMHFKKFYIHRWKWKTVHECYQQNWHNIMQDTVIKQWEDGRV